MHSSTLSVTLLKVAFYIIALIAKKKKKNLLDLRVFLHRIQALEAGLHRQNEAKTVEIPIVPFN